MTSDLPSPRPTGFDAFIFSCKAAAAAVSAFVLYHSLHLPGAVWATVSAVIVTQPTLHPSLQASLFRLLANLIGAFLGSLLIITLGGNVFSLAIGVLLTGLVCHYTRLDDALRPAYVAVVIVILTSESSVWVGSLDRVLAVTIGCVCAILTGILFDRVFSRFLAGIKGYIPTRDPQE